jgi:hypothetical protein
MQNPNILSENEGYRSSPQPKRGQSSGKYPPQHHHSHHYQQQNPSHPQHQVVSPQDHPSSSHVQHIHPSVHTPNYSPQFSQEQLAGDFYSPSGAQKYSEPPSSVGVAARGKSHGRVNQPYMHPPQGQPRDLASIVQPEPYYGEVREHVPQQRSPPHASHPLPPPIPVSHNSPLGPYPQVNSTLSSPYAGATVGGGIGVNVGGIVPGQGPHHGSSSIVSTPSSSGYSTPMSGGQPSPMHSGSPLATYQGPPPESISRHYQGHHQSAGTQPLQPQAQRQQRYHSAPNPDRGGAYGPPFQHPSPNRGRGGSSHGGHSQQPSEIRNSPGHHPLPAPSGPGVPGIWPNPTNFAPQYRKPSRDQQSQPVMGTPNDNISPPPQAHSGVGGYGQQRLSLSLTETSFRRDSYNSNPNLPAASQSLTEVPFSASQPPHPQVQGRGSAFSSNPSPHHSTPESNAQPGSSSESQFSGSHRSSINSPTGSGMVIVVAGKRIQNPTAANPRPSPSGSSQNSPASDTVPPPPGPPQDPSQKYPPPPPECVEKILHRALIGRLRFYPYPPPRRPAPRGVRTTNAPPAPVDEDTGPVGVTSFDISSDSAEDSSPAPPPQATAAKEAPAPVSVAPAPKRPRPKEKSKSKQKRETQLFFGQVVYEITSEQFGELLPILSDGEIPRPPPVYGRGSGCFTVQFENTGHLQYAQDTWKHALLCDEPGIWKADGEAEKAFLAEHCSEQKARGVRKVPTSTVVIRQ